MSAVPEVTPDTAVEPDFPVEAIVVKETKQFYLTSEFWVTAGIILTALAGVLPADGQIATVVVGLAAAAYAVSRGLAKSGVAKVDVAVPEA